MVDLGGCFITPLGAGRLLAWQVVTFGGGGSLINLTNSHFHKKVISAMHFTLTKVLNFFTYSGQGSGAGGQGGGLCHWSTPEYTLRGWWWGLQNPTIGFLREFLNIPIRSRSKKSKKPGFSHTYSQFIAFSSDSSRQTFSSQSWSNFTKIF